MRSNDEDLLASDPYEFCDDWCAARVEATESRLASLPPDAKLIVANHFPLRRELAVLPRIPRFSIWCGTTKTEEWHRRFNIEAVVYGHLHMRSSKVIDGVRFRWSAGDMFVVPSWAALDYVADTDADLFAITDRPALAALGLFREERADGTQTVMGDFDG